MNSYNIVSKYPKGNNTRAEYTIRYQVNKEPKIYSVIMVYVDTVLDEKPIKQYVFLCKDSEGTLRGENAKCLDNSDEDRAIFIEEIKKFQKGGSYRKTHPIIE